MAGISKRGKRSGAGGSSTSCSSYASTIIIILFVALCLVGLWMLTSSSAIFSSLSSSISKVRESKSESKFERAWNDEGPQQEQQQQQQKVEENGDGETVGERNRQEEDHESDGTVTDGGGDLQEETRREQEEPQHGNKEQNSQPEIEEKKEQQFGKREEATENQAYRDEQQIEEKAVENDNNEQQQQNVDNDGDQFHKSAEDNNIAQSEEIVSDPNGYRSEEKSWATQENHSDNENDRRREEVEKNGGDLGNTKDREWELCNVTAGPDYIPCLDNQKAIKLLNFRHFVHRERHCPEDPPTCLVPLPSGYRHSIEWPKSRDRIWYSNVPHAKLAEVKGHQNWVKVTGQYLTFPGGGTQFIRGALHYIDFIQQVKF